MTLPFCGCAITTVGADGSREVVGFVRMKLPASTPAGALAGETIELNVVGLLVFGSPVGGGFALGYSKEQLTGLKNNVLVLDAAPCSAGATDRQRECSR
ncbi:MAG: hypothetical protein JNL87_12185 [Burkholderiaceae bacterium]|nr:hypothetical protein [Burkholderiaceae bacterium]